MKAKVVSSENSSVCEHKIRYAQFTEMAPVIEIACNECGKGVRATYIYRHFNRYHSESAKKFSCDVDPCSKEFFTKGRLDDHMQTNHGERLEMIFCDSCEKTFSSKERLQEHKSYKHTVAPISFACLKCPKTFDNEKAYKKHLQKLHLDLPCDFCGKKLGSVIALKQHKKSKHP